MSFTKAQVFEWLEGYSEKEIESVLKELGYQTDCNTYPEDVVEKAQFVFDTVSEKIKSLPSQDNSIVLQVNNELSLQDIHIAPEILTAVILSIKTVAEQTADSLSSLAQEIFLAKLKSNQATQGFELIESIEANGVIAQSNLKKVIESISKTYQEPIKQFNLQAWMEERTRLEVKSAEQKNKEEVMRLKLEREGKEARLLELDEFLKRYGKQD
jgi:hypothetical protein